MKLKKIQMIKIIERHQTKENPIVYKKKKQMKGSLYTLLKRGEKKVYQNHNILPLPPCVPPLESSRCIVLNATVKNDV